MGRKVENIFQINGINKKVDLKADNSKQQANKDLIDNS